MARTRHVARRRNPDDDLPRWVWPALAGLGVLMAASVIVRHVERANKPVYYYWAQSSPVPGVIPGSKSTQWIPKIQEKGQAIVFDLSPEITQTAALWAAEDEIRIRGGKAQRGEPVG